MKRIDLSIICDSGLHDWNVCEIHFDNLNGVVTINGKPPEIFKEPEQLVFTNVTSLLVTQNEPWGAGSYVVASEFTAPDCQGKRTASFVLNSGDKIEIITTENPDSVH